MIPRCLSRIAHESGAVLRCTDAPGHLGDHVVLDERWTDDDDRAIEAPPVLVGSVGTHTINIGDPPDYELFPYHPYIVTCLRCGALVQRSQRHQWLHLNWHQ
jgi:hypothetical protein